ncbi:hypothetical protein HII31_08172 [Pseudocercospora fuligena]|uniref:Fungal lipase-type domain-containing protein n=1 Tax=Pseudocercospora fuligena TaxID=685502 RepID=A0A8H6RG35_9PEZI|nr:hypothetical protein HII31_08172 [Pseudocercospora fuligena]
MPLVKLENSPTGWHDVKDAADILWRISLESEINTLRTSLRNHYSDPTLTIRDLHTGINNSRRAVLVSTKQKCTIAFEGSHPDEWYKNTWTDGKGPGWWEFPYPVYDENGHRIHSFYRDMWYGMRTAAFAALDAAIDKICEPKQIIITGFSMGGGVSILAFTDILEHIRKTYGSASSSPQAWAADDNLGALIQHITFAAVAAADQGYYTVLNRLYERHGVRAWDFMNHRDWTQHIHHFAFRSWRGYKYILPEAVVGQFNAEFGDQGHFILGYLKAAEWMLEHGTDQVKSAWEY